MRRFAEDTSVSVEKSRAEIETLLARYGCRDFGYRVKEGLALINFQASDRFVRFAVALPLADDPRFQFRKVRGLKKRATPEQQHRAWEQECRRLWRCLALSIKAKLEAVQSGIAQFEDEFLANVVDPASGRTMAELARPYLAATYKGMPAPEGFLALPAPEASQ